MQSRRHGSRSRTCDGAPRMAVSALPHNGDGRAEHSQVKNSSSLANALHLLRHSGAHLQHRCRPGGCRRRRISLLRQPPLLAAQDDRCVLRSSSLALLNDLLLRLGLGLGYLNLTWNSIHAGRQRQDARYPHPAAATPRLDSAARLFELMQAKAACHRLGIKLS